LKHLGAARLTARRQTVKERCGLTFPKPSVANSENSVAAKPLDAGLDP